MEPPLLSIRGLSLVRPAPEGRGRFLFDVAALEVGRGDRLGLVGESGSGKTTLLELLALLIWPAALDAYAFTPDPDEPPVELAPALLARATDTLTDHRARWFGLVPQDGGLIPYLTIAENAELAAELATGKQLPVSRLQSLADAMGMRPYLNRKPSGLSGGQRQRAAVLRAVSPGARLLLCDEPTASLDPGTAEGVMTMLVETAASAGASLVVSSHNAPLLRSYGFRLMQVTVEAEGDDRRAHLSALAA